MKDINLNKAWEVVYPVGLYYVLTNAAAFLITLVVPYSNESYGFIKVLATLFTLPFLYRLYQSDLRMYGRPGQGAAWLEHPGSDEGDGSDAARFGGNGMAGTGDSTQFGGNGLAGYWGGAGMGIAVYVAIAVMAACASIVLNNLIAWTPLVDYSANYRQISEAFYAGSMFFEVLGPCILVPILEEVVFRGLVYGRLRRWLRMPWAVLWSAIIFGLMHMNIVQFVYAGFLGALMALCVERLGGSLRGAILAHIMANAVSVIRSRTPWLDWMRSSVGMDLAVTAVLALILAGCALWLFQKRDTIA